jgi:sugar lactone lactonase YvrE
MPMGESIGSFALRRSGGFVVALRSGLWLFRADGTPERKVADAPYDPAHHRFNDGRCDFAGRFFAGSMNEKRDANSASLIRLDPDFSVTRILDDMMVSNGLAWSPDGRTMYHADTPTHVIRAFAYDVANGMPSSPRVFAQWANETDRPDGAAVDSAGNYWSRSIAVEGSSNCRRGEMSSPNTRHRPCVRRCVLSAARICARFM